MDKVVAAVQHKYDVVVITERGKIYKITFGDFGYEATVQLVGEIDLSRP